MATTNDNEGFKGNLRFNGEYFKYRFVSGGKVFKGTRRTSSPPSPGSESVIKTEVTPSIKEGK